MQGLAKNTEEIFFKVSVLECIQDYTLIGGTALSLQIGHRKSEDLDFRIWSKNLKKDKPSVNWPAIEREISTIGVIESRDVLGFDQVNFLINGVRVTFMSKPGNLSPVRIPVTIQNNIVAADLAAIGAMKIELILRRSEFRDYYDIYSILRHGISLPDMIKAASEYSNRLLKTRDALSYLSNGKNYRMPAGFSLLEPVYDIDSIGIEQYIRELIIRDYPK